MFKKLFAVLLALMIPAAAAMAEGDGFEGYTGEQTEASSFDSIWALMGEETVLWRVESFAEEDGFKVTVYHELEDGKQDLWEYSAAYQEAEHKLITTPTGIHTREARDGTVEETYYEDGAAEFMLNESGRLIWKDLKEDAGRGMEFAKIGFFFGSQWRNGSVQIEFWAWYDGVYDVRLTKKDAKGNRIDEAVMLGSYDPQSHTLTVEGAYQDGKVFTIAFSYNENGSLVWTQDGVSTVCEMIY
ncbi:MAG: hypothetical protein J6U01_12270 [Clostridia bacterium]|nr:hypothetical protein [Clostridia bacterium]